MSAEITQWLEEIKSLQEQLERSHRDRDAAYASAENWRNLYNTEAQQRRTEAKLAAQSIESLKAEIQQLKEGRADWKLRAEGERQNIEQQVQQFSAGELKAKFIEVMQERDRLIREFERLSEALQAEQAAHLKTRQSLTTALGDTMDRLKATRAALLGGEGASGNSPIQNPLPSQTPPPDYQLPALPKTPSLQLPPINPDRDPV